MTATLSPHVTTKAPLTTDGQEIAVVAGRHTIHLIRVTADLYRVVVLDEAKQVAPGWKADFTPERISLDVTVEQAARNFAKAAYLTFAPAAETPAQLVTRVRAHREAVPA